MDNIFYPGSVGTDCCHNIVQKEDLEYNQNLYPKVLEN